MHIKHLFSTFIIAMLVVFINNRVEAQQAKAYEMVHYTAKAGNMLFKLDYADGYIGASRVTLQQPQHKTQVFFPENGVAEQNGDFLFGPQAISDQGKIKLTHINEEALAPATIRATFQLKNINFKLIFSKTNK